MKKILTLMAFVAVIFVSQTIGSALTTPKVEEQKDINQAAVNQIVTSKTTKNDKYDQMAAEMGKRYHDNIKNCIPLHFDQHLDIFGFKLELKADIVGWVSNKCKYTFSGRIDGLGKDIKEVMELNISDETISKFEPKIECNFTKNDLATILEAFAAANARSEAAVSNIMKSPEKRLTQKSNLSPAEEKLMNLLAGGEVCKVINKDDLMKNFTEVMSSGDL